MSSQAGFGRAADLWEPLGPTLLRGGVDCPDSQLIGHSLVLRSGLGKAQDCWQCSHSGHTGVDTQDHGFAHELPCHGRRRH